MGMCHCAGRIYAALPVSSCARAPSERARERGRERETERERERDRERERERRDEIGERRER